MVAVVRAYFLYLSKVDGLTCRALIDSGCGSSYASAQLISALVIKQSEIKDQQIDMLLTSRKAKVEQYEVKITSYDGRHKMMTRLKRSIRASSCSLKTQSTIS
jgi:hypothetical protein